MSTITKTRIAGGERVKNHFEEIAGFYGFKKIPAPVVQKTDAAKARKICGEDFKQPKGEARLTPTEITALFEYYDTHLYTRERAPAMVFYSAKAEDKTYGNHERMALHFMSCEKSVSEAIIIKAACEILRENNNQNLFVDISSIGDRENFSRFMKEFISYYKKKLDGLSSFCRQNLKHDPLALCRCVANKCREIHEKAPDPVSFLSENSRRHLTEVLEFLESDNIPYRLNPSPLSDKCLSTSTVFEIRSIDEADEAPGKILAAGCRYNGFAKKLGFRKDVPSVGIALLYDRCKSERKLKSKDPMVYFIQLGFEAKLKSLKILETLRKAKISVCQSLSRDKLSVQLSAAENQRIPYALILGQKEAMEESVILRNMMNHSQETIKINILPDCLKKLKV